MKNILLPLLLALLCLHATSQIIISENFEPRDGYTGGTTPPGWTQDFEKGYESFEFITGGHWANPDTAAQGIYNAAFIVESPLKEKTKLVTPVMDLTALIRPRVSFYLVQQTWWVGGIPYNDELRLFYKKSYTSNWIPVNGAVFSSGVEDWTRMTVYLDSLDLSSTYYLGFEATTGYGHGTCIDSIIIEEAGLVEKEVSDVIVEQASTNFIATGSEDNPILKLNIKTKGNNGTLMLEQINVTSLNIDDSEVSPLGVKLYSTPTNEFYEATLIAGGVDFSSGIATFSGINKELGFGSNYFWITYDVEPDALPANSFDAKIDADAITISGITYPTTELSPAGNRSIQETMLFDGFETLGLWDLNGFEIGMPASMGGFEGGNPDPVEAAKGLNVLRSIDTIVEKIVYGVGGVAVDTIIDTAASNYISHMTDRQYYAITPTIDCKYYVDVRFSYDRWLNVEIWDNAYIDISKDDGATWTNIWKSGTNFVTDNSWTFHEIDISKYADKQNAVKLRYALGSSSADKNYSGWNIDNFVLTANFIDSDVAVEEWIHPQSACGLLSNDSVVVRVRNYAGLPTNDTIPIEFSLDGGITFVRDTIFGVIPVDGDTVYTFVPRVNLTLPGYYQAVARTVVEDDEATNNDELQGPHIFSIPTYTIPYKTDFEDGPSFWEVQGKETTDWEWGNPSSLNISETASGINAWVTDLDGNFERDDSSFVVSPCFDFTGINYPVFEVKFIHAMDSNAAGFRFEYSLNEGQSWSLIPNDTYPYSWNWLSGDTIAALDYMFGDPDLGHTGVNLQWQTYRVLLPQEIANVSGVKFRIAFASTPTGNRADGVAFDDVRIYNAPIDVGVISLDTPIHSCELSKNEKVTVTIENFGLDSLFPGDSIFVAMDFKKVFYNIDTVVISSKIAPGETFTHEFNDSVNVFKARTYYIDAYTMVPEDTAFYEVYNDTLVDSVVVYGLPEYDLGQDFGSVDPATVILDAGAGYTTYNWSTGETTQTTAIPGPAVYYVTVTNDSLCSAVDSIKVYYSAKDLSCDTILGLTNGCAVDFVSARDITIQITNNKLHAFSDSIFFATDNISFGYQINDEDIVFENYISNDTLLPDSTMLYTFTTQADFSAYQDYTIRAFTFFDRDIEITNDSDTIYISNWGYPEVDLGDSVILTSQADTILFNAGTGFATYTWQDGSSLQTFDVTATYSKEYSVTVTDVNGCGTAIDTVKVFTYDIGIDSIVSPVAGCVNSGAETLVFSITNYSMDTITSTLPIKMAYLFNNTPPFIEEDLFVTDTLFPDSSTVLAFTNTFDLSEEKAYNMKIFNRLAHDINPLNNIVIKDINTYGYPVMDIGFDTIFTANKDTVIFDATADRDADYKWNASDQTGSSTNSLFDVVNPQSFLYKVTVTSNGCAVKDSVLLWMKDLRVDSVNVPDQACELSETQNITTYVSIPNNDYFLKGEKVVLALAIDENRIIYDTLQFAANYYKSSGPLGFTFSESVDLSAVGNHKIRSFISSQYDVNQNNDTIIKNVNVVGYPQPDLGLPDTIFTTQLDTLVLSVIDTYNTYRWQDNAIGKTYPNPVDEPGLYTVTVSWSPGCTGVDSVRVVAYDIKVSTVFGIDDACAHTNTESLQIDIYNPSPQTIPSGSQIVAGYSFEGNEYRDTIILTADFNYMDIYTHTFTNTIDAATIGNYSLKAWCSFENDFKRSNDTLSYSFSTFGNPVPDFGFDTIYSTLADNIKSMTLSTSINYFRYIWNDGTNLSSNDYKINSDSTALYTVRVITSDYCEVVDTIVVINQDLQLDTIYSPIDACVISADEPVSFRVKNVGEESFPAGTKIYGYLYVDEVLALTDSVVLSAYLDSAQTVDILFDSTYDFTVNDSFAIRAVIACDLDFIPSTDELQDTLENWGFETVDLGYDVIVTSQPDTVTLSLPNTYVAYEWSDGITITNVFAVPENATKYWSVTTTDIWGCRESDSVLFITRQLSLDSLISDTSSCDFGGEYAITAVFTNTGADTIPAGTEIGYAYNWKTSGSRFAYKDTLDAYLAPDSSLVYDFADTLPLLGNGIHILEIETYYLNGTDTIRVIKTQNIHQFVTPVIDINNGIDTITEALPVILSVDNGYANYLWSTTAVDTFTVAEKSGTYSITVTSKDGCTTMDSVIVIAFELGLSEILYPKGTICSADFIDSVSLRITNTGSDTLDSAFVIPIEFNVNLTGSTLDTLYLLEALAPDSSVVMPLNENLNISNEGSYLIKVFLNMETSVDPTNDTVVRTFSYHISPAFELAQGQNNISVLYLNYLTGPDNYAQYEWQDGSTSQDYQVATTGLYSLTVTDDNGCTATDDVSVTVIGGSSIADIDSENIQVYPVPATDILFIQFEENIQNNIVIQIFDSGMKRSLTSEKVVSGSKQIQIGVSDLANGVYYLKISIDEAVYFKKFIKK